MSVGCGFYSIGSFSEDCNLAKPLVIYEVLKCTIQVAKFPGQCISTIHVLLYIQATWQPVARMKHCVGPQRVPEVT